MEHNLSHNCDNCGDPLEGAWYEWVVMTEQGEAHFHAECWRSEAAYEASHRSLRRRTRLGRAYA